MRRRRRLSALGAVVVLTVGLFAVRAVQPDPAEAAPVSRAVFSILSGDPLGAGYYILDNISVAKVGEQLNVTMSGTANGSSHTFTLEVAPPAGVPIDAQQWWEAREVGSATVPKVKFSRSAPTPVACATTYGDFYVRSITFSGDTPTSLAMDFHQRCNGNTDDYPVAGGWLSWNQPTGPIDNVPAGELVPIDPVRRLDTRSGSALGMGGVIDVTVTGNGVPGNATAVVANITAVDPTAQGYLTAYPSGTATPAASNLNFMPGETIPNLAIVRVGNGGQISILNSAGSTHVLVDVVAYFAPADQVAGGRFRGLPPIRVLDTRVANNIQWGELPANVPINIPVDFTATAAVLNVTVVNATTTGYATVYPANQQTPPTVSNLNFTPGKTIANSVVVKLDNGQAKLLNSNGASHFVVDIVGLFKDDDQSANGPGRFVPVNWSEYKPIRLIDTRTFGWPGRAFDPGEFQRYGLVGLGTYYPLEYAGVVANMTVTGTTSIGHLSVWPGGSPSPNSNLNWSAGDTRANLVFSGTDDMGAVDVFNSNGETHVIIDVAGWFTR